MSILCGLFNQRSIKETECSGKFDQAIPLQNLQKSFLNTNNCILSYILNVCYWGQICPCIGRGEIRALGKVNVITVVTPL